MSKENITKPANKTGNNNSKPVRNSGHNKPRHFRGNNNKPQGKGKDDALVYESSVHSQTSGNRKGNSSYPGNDIAWYQRVPNLLDTAKQVAFNIPHGAKLNSTKRPVPGILALDYCPIIGYCEPNPTTALTYARETEFYDVWASTPFNIAMREAYSKVRSSKGGSRPYDYPDLAHMLLSAASIFAYIVHLHRVLKSVNRFNFANKYLGQSLVGMFGFDYSDLIQNFPTYVTRLNLLVEKARSVAVPAGMAVIDEWLWRNSNIFKDTDTDNVKQQYLVDVPNGFYVYDEANGDCNYKALTIRNKQPLHMAEVIGQLESAVAQLWNSETFALLMGDIRYAYNNNVLTIPQMGLDDVIEPVFSLEHAIGVQNMSYLHTAFGTTGAEFETDSDINGMTDQDLEIALSVHQDLRSAELNNGAVYAGFAYGTEAVTKLRGYKIHVGQVGISYYDTVHILLNLYHSNGFDKYSFINLYSDIPDGETLVYATRMKMVGSFCNNEGGDTFTDDNRDMYYRMTSSTCCLWLCPRILKWPDHYSFDTIDMAGNVITNVLCVSGSYRFRDDLFALSTFHIAPKAIVYALGVSALIDDTCALVLGDVEVGTDIANDALTTLQSVCLYSQWLIPDTINVSGFTPRVLTK